MVNKISFPHSNDWGVIGPNGDHALPVDSELGHRFQMVDGAVVDLYGGVTDDEVKTLDAENADQKQLDDVQAIQNALVIQVKIEASERIAKLDWKVERAKERDSLNSTTTVKDVFAAREAIRAESDAAELAIASLTTPEEIRAFTW